MKQEKIITKILMNKRSIAQQYFSCYRIKVLFIVLVSGMFSCVKVNGNWCQSINVECNTKSATNTDIDSENFKKDSVTTPPPCTNTNDIDCDNIPNTTDIDADGDGLIEIKDATMLSNIRYALGGTRYKKSSSDVGNVTGCHNSGCQGYELSNNINLAGVNWVPIGDSSSNTFSSIFNGNGYEIQNLTITSSAITYLGLFGYISSATISNVGVVGISITATNTSGIYVGGLVGSSDGTISNSYAKGFITIPSSGQQTSVYAGGLVGVGSYSTTITNSYTTVNVLASSSVYEGSVYAGGLVGSSARTISNSYATGNVSASVSNVYGNAWAEGLVGGINGATISNSIYNSSATFTRNGSTITPTQPTGVTPLTEANIKLGLGQVVDILGITHYKFVAGSLPKVYKQGSTTELVSGQ